MCPLKTNNYKQGVLEGNIDSCQAEAATKFLHIFFLFFFKEPVEGDGALLFEWNVFMTVD